MRRRRQHLHAARRLQRGNVQHRVAAPANRTKRVEVHQHQAGIEGQVLDRVAGEHRGPQRLCREGQARIRCQAGEQVQIQHRAGDDGGLRGGARNTEEAKGQGHATHLCKVRQLEVQVGRRGTGHRAAGCVGIAGQGGGNAGVLSYDDSGMPGEQRSVHQDRAGTSSVRRKHRQRQRISSPTISRWDRCGVVMMAAMTITWS
mmetsp:Transcript_26441/g.73978  ORF Transcript_26441/g.73978 Transcript_26441/m.73978 type:complete len:202 (+) Transcript_26441:791-1396(+)